MKTKSFLAVASAFALAIAGLSIPVFSGKALAQMTDSNGQAAKGKKGATNADKPKGPLYKSAGSRSKCRMGNC
jgi:hypothetical protein